MKRNARNRLSRHYTNSVFELGSDNMLLHVYDLAIRYEAPEPYRQSKDGRAENKEPDPLWSAHFEGWRKAYREWKAGGEVGMKPLDPMPSGHCMFEMPVAYGCVRCVLKSGDELQVGDGIIVNERPVRIVEVGGSGKDRCIRYECWNVQTGEPVIMGIRCGETSMVAFDYAVARKALENTVRANLDGWDRELKKTEEGREQLAKIVNATVDARLRGVSLGGSPYVACITSGI